MAQSRRKAAGFSLLEVLVSIVVLSMGLLGAVGMLMTAVRTTNESGSFTTAVNLVRELSEKARINKNIAARNGVGNAYVLDDWRSSRDALPGVDSATACTGVAAACSQAELAAWDLRNWLQRVKTSLPEARVAVCFDDAPWDAAKNAHAWGCSSKGRNLVVKLGWAPRLRSDDEKDADSRPPRVVMQLIPGQDYDGYSPVAF
ncbi:type IV pilus modification protein PilV [Variovorax sp. RT4R15]|uniref:type IV pilus modification protein PilV n=1 Tax=Variovorax sp. RT4R15 TaxID=3443737 RepID=UPI003F476298